MEGPTPVSALLHAATMVTAGVYLIVHISPCITPDILYIIIILGGLSALLGSSGAIVDSDLKKIIAYSTTSQLGYMVLSIGIGFNHLSMYH
jgi:NADH:ubiquinone oxidoreductase subunit 5 (subunit L)/multisubunit Na+/H+ antiporter MnhA subunit